MYLGYGSLMNEESKGKTSQGTTHNLPVLVRNFERGWFVHSHEPAMNTTYLGIRVKQSAQMNAVIFQLDHAQMVKEYDRREKSYCRMRIQANEITMLTHDPIPKGQIWAYYIDDTQINLPDKSHPIVQSYVDLFLSGCLALEKKYALHNFSTQCIQYTSQWPVYWINDRIYPRRPFFSVPYARKIDDLLRTLVPKRFSSMVIETSQSA